MSVQAPERSSYAWMAGSAVLACICLIWPAIILGQPIVSPDTPAYFKAGDIAGKLIGEFLSPASPTAITDLKGAGEHLIPNDAVGIRSAYYGFFVWLLSAASVWLIPTAQALMALYAIYRFLAAFTTLTSVSLVVVILALATASTLPWFTSYIMPDVLAGVAILLLATLLFEPGRRSRWVILLDCGLIFFCLISHNSIFLLALSLLLIVLAAAAICRKTGWAKPLAQRAGLLALLLASTVVAQIAVSYVAFGKVALTERTPPFLLAKSVMDGPGRLYLRDACAKNATAYFMCRYVDRFPGTENEFLWAADGIYMRATPEERSKIRAEQSKIVMNAALTHPWLQLRTSLINIWNNLLTFNLATVRVDLKWNGAEGGYRALEDRPPPLTEQLRAIANQLSHVITLVSLLVVIGWALRAGFRNLPPAAPFVLLALLGNAAITGVFSSGSGRYQARVIWLMPLVAVLMVSSAYRTHPLPSHKLAQS